LHHTSQRVHRLKHVSRSASSPCTADTLLFPPDDGLHSLVGQAEELLPSAFGTMIPACSFYATNEFPSPWTMAPSDCRVGRRANVLLQVRHHSSSLPHQPIHFFSTVQDSSTRSQRSHASQGARSSEHRPKRTMLHRRPKSHRMPPESSSKPGCLTHLPEQIK